MPLKFYGNRLEKVEKKYIYDDWKYQVQPSIQLWIEYKDMFLLYGYFILKNGNKGPFEKIFCKNHGLNRFQVFEQGLGTVQDVKEFKDFLIANNITFI